LAEKRPQRKMLQPKQLNLKEWLSHRSIHIQAPGGLPAEVDFKIWAFLEMTYCYSLYIADFKLFIQRRSCIFSKQDIQINVKSKFYSFPAISSYLSLALSSNGVVFHLFHILSSTTVDLQMLNASLAHFQLFLAF
jgi:hypothetical protein